MGFLRAVRQAGHCEWGGGWDADTGDEVAVRAQYQTQPTARLEQLLVELWSAVEFVHSVDFSCMGHQWTSIQ